MIGIFKGLMIGAGLLVGLVVLALSCLLLLLFPEWVRWIAGGVTAFAVGWFFLVGRFRRKSGLLINDGTVYDRWRGRSKTRKDFL
jgi:hypothetical protein